MRIPTDRNQLFRSIATSAARVLTAPLDEGGDVSVSCRLVKHGLRSSVVVRRGPARAAASPNGCCCGARGRSLLTHRKGRGVACSYLRSPLVSLVAGELALVAASF